jgi:hypothetical protein
VDTVWGSYDKAEINTLEELEQGSLEDGPARQDLRLEAYYKLLMNRYLLSPLRPMSEKTKTKAYHQYSSKDLSRDKTREHLL